MRGRERGHKKGEGETGVSFAWVFVCVCVCIKMTHILKASPSHPPYLLDVGGALVSDDDDGLIIHAPIVFDGVPGSVWVPV